MCSVKVWDFNEVSHFGFVWMELLFRGMLLWLKQRESRPEPELPADRLYIIDCLSVYTLSISSQSGNT